MEQAMKEMALEIHPNKSCYTVGGGKTFTEDVNKEIVCIDIHETQYHTAPFQQAASSPGAG